jgi:hypothetical protein
VDRAAEEAKLNPANRDYIVRTRVAHVAMLAISAPLSRHKLAASRLNFIARFALSIVRLIAYSYCGCFVRRSLRHLGILVAACSRLSTWSGLHAGPFLFDRKDSLVEMLP